MRYFLIILITVLLSACGNKALVNTKPQITQEILLERCTDDTPIPTKSIIDKYGNKGYSGDEILNVLIQWQHTYDECAVRHDVLIKTIRDMQKQDIVVKIKEK